MIRLRDKCDRDLPCEEKDIGRKKFTAFDRSNANPSMNMLKFISEKYEGDERTYVDKDGEETVSSYKLLLVANNSNGFDSWVVLNSLVKEITELKIMKTARGLI